jgi:hypothetical protein
MFLLRFENRMVVCQILERGWAHARVLIKGGF